MKLKKRRNVGISIRRYFAFFDITSGLDRNTSNFWFLHGTPVCLWIFRYTMTFFIQSYLLSIIKSCRFKAIRSILHVKTFIRMSFCIKSTTNIPIIVISCQIKVSLSFVMPKNEKLRPSIPPRYRLFIRKDKTVKC